MSDSSDYLELLWEARAIKSETESICMRVEERHECYLNKLAGEAVDRARKDRAEAEKCLWHSDKNVRIVGLNILMDVWQAKESAFRAQYEYLIWHDHDEEVRAVAINCLSTCYEATNDQRVTGMLADFVRNEVLSTEIRTAAYFGLLVVTGEFKRRPEVILDFGFPKDVDWAYVDGFR